MESVFVPLTGVLLLGCAVLVSSQPTIHPSGLTTLEGSSAVFSCSFPDPSGILSLSVHELTTSKHELNGIQKNNVNKNQALNVLGISYTLLALNNSAEIELTFNAARALNGFTFQCISTVRASSVESGSEIITLNVEYPPSFLTVNVTVDMVITSTPLQFQLNCSDKIGNPSPNIAWTYDNNLVPLITQTGPQNSVLIFQIDSLQMVPVSLYSESLPIVCNASNHLGSATKNTTLLLSATPSAPQDMDCSLTESCSIRCTWKEPEFPGSSTRTSYELVISRNGQEKRTLTETLLPGQTDYIIPKTPSDFYTPNTDLKASIQAVSKVGSSVASSDAFVLPGPCRKPKSLSGEHVNETSVNVSWKAPDCDNPNVPVHTFNVTADDVNGTKVFHRELGSQSTSVVIPSLNPDMKYTVTVVGINCYGSTPPAIHPIPRLTEGTASPSSSSSTTVYISSQTTNKSSSGQEPGTEDGAVVGIAIACFVVGVVVGICLSVVVQRLWFFKLSKRGQSSSSEEHVTVSSAYDLPERSRSEPTYADIADKNRQETPSHFTSSSAYLTTADC